MGVAYAGRISGSQMNDLSIKNSVARAYVSAAAKLGIEIEIISAEDSYARLHHGNNELFVKDDCISCNDVVASYCANNRALTLGTLGTSGFPIPKYEFFKSSTGFREATEIDALFEFFDRCRPLVLRPNTVHSRRGTFTNITDDESFAAAISAIQRAGFRRILLHHQSPGNRYAVTIFRDQVLNVTVKDKPGRVIDPALLTKDVSDMLLQAVACCRLCLAEVSYVSTDLTAPPNSGSGVIHSINPAPAVAGPEQADDIATPLLKHFFGLP